MSVRSEVATLLGLDDAAFRRRAGDLLARRGLDTDRLAALDADSPSAPPGLDPSALAAHERPLVRRARVLAEVPLAVTLAGPVYEDTPVRYADGTFTSLTGYDLAAVRGENLRLLQGPATEPEAVDALREALDTWEPVTVDLWNYRADGTRFRNRVSLVPYSGPDGTVTNWFGLQGAVEG